MSSKRFWDETPADDSGADSAPGTPDPAAGDGLDTFGKHSPVRPGDESAIDPDTGEWKPTHVLEEFEIDGHKFRWMEGPIAEAQVRDADGNHLASVMVPFDPDDGEPDDAMLGDVQRWYQGLEYIRSIVKQDAIDAVVSNLVKYKADGQRSIAEIMVSTVVDALIEGIKITVTDDDSDLTAQQLKELQAEVDRLFAKFIPDAVESITEVVNPNTGLTFWQDMARDVIAHALMYARDAATEEYGGPEAVKALDDDAAAAWDARVNDLYATGPFLSGAYMQGYQTWLPVLGEMVRAGLDDAIQQPTDDPESLFGRILKRARENLGYPPLEPGTDTPMPALHGDAMPQTQAGLVDLTSLGMHQVVIREVGNIGTWEIKVDGGRPERRLQGRNTSGHLYIDGDGAMRLWQELQGKSIKARTRAQRDILPDVLIAVLATASARRGQLDLFGNGTSYMPIDWLMKNVGLTGKHKASDVDKLYAGLRVISDIQMTGSRTAWIGGKPVDIPFIGPMWQIMETVPKVGTVEEYERFLQAGPSVPAEHTYSTPIPPLDIAGVSLAIGAGLIATVDENPQFAQVVARLMEYSPVHGRYKRWLGFVLSWAFRDRKKQQSWEQAFTVRKLLDDAGLPVDEKPNNPDRPFTLFHEALETLQADGVIGEYHYPGTKGGVFTRGGRGWYQRWLDASLVILPPEAVRTAYLESNRKALARSRKRQPPKAG